MYIAVIFVELLQSDKSCQTNAAPFSISHINQNAANIIEKFKNIKCFQCHTLRLLNTELLQLKITLIDSIMTWLLHEPDFEGGHLT